MRRLRGKSRDSNSATNLRTESQELRSSPITITCDSGNSDTIRALVSSAALRLRAGNTSRAPRFASTLAVSAPIPDVAPVMMAVIGRRSRQRPAVTCSAVDLELKPLAPAVPIRYFTVSSIFLISFLCVPFSLYNKYIYRERERGDGNWKSKGTLCKLGTKV